MGRRKKNVVRLTDEEVKWLNKHRKKSTCQTIVDRIMTRQCLSRRIDSIENLKSELSALENERSNLEAKDNWHFRTKDVRIKLVSLYPDL